MADKGSDNEQRIVKPARCVTVLPTDRVYTLNIAMCEEGRHVEQPTESMTRVSVSFTQSRMDFHQKAKVRAAYCLPLLVAQLLLDG